VAAYSDASLKDKMQGLKNDKQMLNCLQEGPTSFCIEMAFKVGAEKMATAIAEAGELRVVHRSVCCISNAKHLSS
jgi:hypothetical protein